jgi:hypothetical protein
MSEEKKFDVMRLLKAISDRGDERENTHARDLFELANAGARDMFITALWNAKSLSAAYIDAVLAGTKSKEEFDKEVADFESRCEAALRSIKNNRKEYREWKKKQDSKEDSE